MIRTVLFPLRTRSLNVSFRGNGHFARDAATKRERAATGKALNDPRFGPRPTADAIRTGLHVDIVRVAVGTLDYPTNLGGALKSVQDEIALWIGINDRDWRMWDLLQAKCERSPTPALPSYQGVRVRVTCSTPGPDLDIVCGTGPARIGPESHDGEGELPRREHGNDPRRRATRAAIARVSPIKVPTGLREDLTNLRRIHESYFGKKSSAPKHLEQLALTYRNAWVLRPWEQTGDGLPELAELALVDDGRDPPRWITERVPTAVRALTQTSKAVIYRLAKETVRLERHLVRSAELGGEAWVYAERGCAELAYFAEGAAAE